MKSGIKKGIACLLLMSMGVAMLLNLSAEELSIKKQVYEEAFEARFEEGKIGERIDNKEDYNFRAYKEALVEEVICVPGTLFMSDSPEVVEEPGILYEDYFTGTGSVLLHHLNGMVAKDNEEKKQKLMLIVVNDGQEVATLTLKNEAIRGPATDVTRIGQKVTYDYLTGTKPRQLTLIPGEKKLVYTHNWTTGSCISGLFDLETDRPIRMMVVAAGEEVSLEAADQLKHLSWDGVHISGTFDGVGLNYKIKLESQQPTKLLLGDNGNEEWLDGYDSRSQDEVQNKGNFGVLYSLTLSAEEDMGVLLNSRGAGLQGAIKWKGEGVYQIPEQGILAQTTTQAVLLGVIKKGETKTLQYILPNGSSAPVLIAFVPKSYW